MKNKINNTVPRPGVNFGSAFDNLSEQILNISKAGAFDIVSKHNGELLEENAAMKARAKYLEDLLKEYTGKEDVLNCTPGAHDPDDLRDVFN